MPEVLALIAESRRVERESRESLDRLIADQHATAEEIARVRERVDQGRVVRP